jgi:hypothetical protein
MATAEKHKFYGTKGSFLSANKLSKINTCHIEKNPNAILISQYLFIAPILLLPIKKQYLAN